MQDFQGITYNLTHYIYPLKHNFMIFLSASVRRIVIEMIQQMCFCATHDLIEKHIVCIVDIFVRNFPQHLRSQDPSCLTGCKILNLHLPFLLKQLT